MGDRCVLPDECPSTEEEEKTEQTEKPTMVCPGDKTYMECGSPCSATCENQSPACITICTSGEITVTIFSSLYN